MKRHALIWFTALGLGSVLTAGPAAGADLQLTIDPARAGAEFEGIIASLDGRPIAEVRDWTYPRGLVGLVSCFHPARFDNLQITTPVP